MNNPSHSQIAAYLTDHAISELVGYVMEDTGCPLQKAMDTVYNSELMKQLENEEIRGRRDHFLRVQGSH